MAATSSGFVVERCRGCGLRYPVDVGNPRQGTCPVCQTETDVVADYDPPHTASQSGPSPPQRRVVGVLDSVRSALNVGTMLRAADGAGLCEVHLCGLTADVDNPKLVKTALGAERAVATTWWPDVVGCVDELKEAGYEIWALESTPTAELIAEVDFAHVDEGIAVVVGNEVAGVDPHVLERATRCVHLPMRGTKSTLNVGVAFGIAAYALTGA